MKGWFISLEGAEGGGKTTQIEFLAQRLTAQGRKVTVTREPGGTAVGEEIRALLLNGPLSLTAEAELFLYLAARGQLVREVILPALHRGGVVLCDRFLDSTLAYQGYGRGLDLDLIRQANRLSTGGLLPHLTLLLDLPVEEGLGRKGEGKDRLEREDMAFHRRVREGYLALAAEDGKRIKVIPATHSREEVGDLAGKEVARLLEGAGA